LSNPPSGVQSSWPGGPQWTRTPSWWAPAGCHSLVRNWHRRSPRPGGLGVALPRAAGCQGWASHAAPHGCRSQPNLIWGWAPAGRGHAVTHHLEEGTVGSHWRSRPSSSSWATDRNRTPDRAACHAWDRSDLLCCPRQHMHAPAQAGGVAIGAGCRARLARPAGLAPLLFRTHSPC